MSIEIIDLADKAKRAFYENRIFQEGMAAQRRHDMSQTFSKAGLDIYK
jgi:hypothetical protein